VIRSDALVVGPRFRARHALLEALGVTISEQPGGMGGRVRADATGQTAAPGVWVAGNVADVTAGVMQSAASGVTAGVAINADLTAEDTDRAVAAARGSGSRGGAAPPRQRPRPMLNGPLRASPRLRSFAA